MNCQEARGLLEAAVDGELDLMRELEVEQHAAGCASCAALRENLRERQTVLRQSLARYEAPAQLRAKVLALARPPVEAPVAKPRPNWWLPAYSGIGLAAGMAAALVLAVGTGYTWGVSRSRSNALVTEAVGDHIRSLQANHLSDVISTDQHTVKPWFVGKLDFSPPVADLAASGFPLSGGRLEHLDGRPAAALVFHRRQHPLNLFIWPAADRPVASRQTAQYGFNTQSWSDRGFNYLAVSEIPAEEISQFALAFQAATAH